MASSRPTSSAGKRADAGTLARVFTSQRPALLHYVTRILEGDSLRGETALQAAREELISSPPDGSERDDAELCFAVCHRHAHAAARQDDRTRRFVEPPPRSAQAGSEGDTVMLRHIDRLTPKQQEVIRLKFQNGFGHAAIARITEIPDDKILTLIHTAVAHLRAEFSTQTPVDDPRATASALGEHSDAERIAFAALLRENPTLRSGVAEIRAFARQIQEALEIEAGVRAPRRAKNGAGDSKLIRRRSPLFWLGWSGAVAVAAGIFFYLRSSDSTTRSRQSSTADFTLKPGAWHEPAAEAGKKPTNLRPDLVAGYPSPAKEKEDAEPSVFPPPRTAPMSAPNPVPSEGPTTGEKLRNVADLSGVPDGGAALGEAPPRDGAAMSAGAKPTRAAVNPPTDRKGVKSEPRVAAAPENSSAEKSPEPPVVARGSAVRPARLATKGPGAKGGDDFRTPRENPVSALPSDPDTASVDHVFRAVGAGQLPRPADVRIASLLNYFPTSDVAPTDSRAFSATLESAEAPWDSSRRLVRIGLKAREAPAAPRARANLVFLIDVSASMDLPSRLPLVQEGLRLLLQRLGPDDRVAIVTYAGESRLALPSIPVADGVRIRRVLRALRPAGQTNGGVGIQLAYTIAKGAFVEGSDNRVILCTDGDFNLGITHAETLTALAAKEGKAGISLSVFGFGRGYQIDARLEALAAQGLGRSGYINTRREAERAFAGEVEGLFAPVASDLKLNVAFNPAVVADYRLIGYENRDAKSTDAVPAVAAAESVGSGQTLTALYEIIPASPLPAEESPDTPWLTFRVDYRSPTGVDQHHLEFPLKKSDGKFATASPEFKFATAVAGFGLILQAAAEKDAITLNDVAAWADAGRGDDPGGYRNEFIDLVRAAAAIAPRETAPP